MLQPSHADYERRTNGANGPAADGLVHALIGLFDAGQAIVLDRIDLLRMEVASDVSRFAIALGLVSVGVMVMLAGWAALVASLGALIIRLVDWEYVVLGIGALHVALGVGIIGGASRFAKLRQRQVEAMRELGRRAAGVHDE